MANGNATQPQLFPAPVVPVKQLQCRVLHNGKLTRAWLKAYHSTLKPPAGWIVAFVLTDGITILGVSTWGRPVARKEDQTHTLQHTRMALCREGSAIRNAGSFFLKLNRQYIRAHYPIYTRLIAYVDETKHKGVIYRADNWKVVKVEKVTSSWKNRAGRQGNECKIRVKFEREP